ncbi:MAG: SDR family oxidoreductase [Candidatus Marinimicrobia bacterium]|nr:SDR family oxidoreductase [Candidatus Neomarinimicrobiota bacterium]
MNEYIKKLFSLDNKVAIVTGAAHGNGKAMANALASAGAIIVGVDLDAAINTEIYDISLLGDITKKRDRHKIVDSTLATYGRIDILVNNAGVSYGSNFLEYPDASWDLTYEVNLKAPFELVKLVLPHMMKKHGGSIINITSLNSELGFSNNPAYVTFKTALKGLTKAIAVDFGAYGIRANNIGPGYLKTSMTKKSWDDSKRRKKIKDKTVLGRWGEPNDLAGTVIFLASDASQYITGQDIYVDGGWLIKGL